MRRREFMLLLSGALTAAPRTLRAQQKAIPVIGFLSSAGEPEPGPAAPNAAAFRQGLSETGYVEGQNVAIEYRGRRAAMIGCPHWPPTSSAIRSM
jgi:putative ABC transport system substrate-binding protein